MWIVGLLALSIVLLTGCVQTREPAPDSPSLVKVRLTKSLETIYYGVTGQTTQDIFASLEMNGPEVEDLALPLPVAQDIVKLPELTEWEVMEGEYRTMGIHPSSHVMAYLSKRLGPDVLTSRDVAGLKGGTEVIAAGLVVWRQRP